MANENEEIIDASQIPVKKTRKSSRTLRSNRKPVAKKATTTTIAEPTREAVTTQISHSLFEAQEEILCRYVLDDKVRPLLQEQDDPVSDALEETRAAYARASAALSHTPQEPLLGRAGQTIADQPLQPNVPIDVSRPIGSKVLEEHHGTNDKATSKPTLEYFKYVASVPKTTATNGWMRKGCNGETGKLQPQNGTKGHKTRLTERKVWEALGLLPNVAMMANAAKKKTSSKVSIGTQTDAVVSTKDDKITELIEVTTQTERTTRNVCIQKRGYDLMELNDRNITALAVSLGCDPHRLYKKILKTTHGPDPAVWRYHRRPMQFDCDVNPYFDNLRHFRGECDDKKKRNTKR